ncbi:unnamed protein product [Ascophyllum nodosum]
MRVTRAKQYRKHLRFFRIVYGIVPPYKVILDGNFIHCCVSSNVDIQQRIASVLQGAKLQLYVPQAARKELKALGTKFEKAYKFAAGYCRALPSTAVEAPAAADSGDGEKSYVGADSGGGAGAGSDDPAEEIMASIGPDNARKYVVATQDEDLRLRLRRVPGCPLVYVSRTVLLMEQPSGRSKAVFEKAERKKVGGTSEAEVKALDAIKRKEREEREKERMSQPRKRLKKRASAPNPLSCKKPKLANAGNAGGKGAAGSSDASEGGRKRPPKKRKKHAASGGADAAGGEATGPSASSV